MGRDAYLDLISTIPLFSACSNKDLQKIAKASDEATVEAGRTVVAENTTGHEAYVIIDGNATVERNGQTVAQLGPGDYFGELALFDGGPRTASVVADTELRVLVLGQREFTGVIEGVPGLAGKLLATLATRIRELDQKAYG